MSLRARLGVAAGLAGAVAVIAVAVSAYAGTRSELRGQLDRSLQSLAAQAQGAPSLGSEPPGGSSGGDYDYGSAGRSQSMGQGQGQLGGGLGTGGLDLNRFNHRDGPAFGGARGVAELVAPNGAVEGSAGQQQVPVDARIKAIARRGHGRSFADMTISGTALRVLTTGVGASGALVVALPLGAINDSLTSLLLLLALIAAGGVALAAVLGLLVTRTALAPIVRFTRQTEAIAAAPERLDAERLEVHGGDELARLAQTFNRTLDALERSVQAQRNLVADASHELRTPIATIRANLQLLRDEQLLSAADREALRLDVIEELDELTALVSDVVELARGAKPGGEPGDVRLDEIVSAAVDRTRRRGPGLTVTAELEPTLVRGEGDRIARAVANLLDNAAKWSPPQGVIEVRLGAGTLTVRDHGPGFADEDLPFVFDRFHRARTARSKPGSGLGLAIVRQAAEAHGGTVTAANAADGGALMTIDFARTRDPPVNAGVCADAVSR